MGGGGRGWTFCTRHSSININVYLVVDMTEMHKNKVQTFCQSCQLFGQYLCVWVCVLETSSASVYVCLCLCLSAYVCYFISSHRAEVGMWLLLMYQHHWKLITRGGGGCLLIWTKHRPCSHIWWLVTNLWCFNLSNRPMLYFK